MSVEKMPTDQLKTLIWRRIRAGAMDAEFAELNEEDQETLLRALCDGEEQRRYTRLALATGSRISEAGRKAGRTLPAADGQGD